MKTESKKPVKCNVDLIVTLEADEVKETIKKVERAFIKNARLPGFRPGKAPIELIRKEFAAQMKQEIEQQLVRDNYANAVKAEGIDAVDLSDVKDIKYDENGGSFTAVVEINPTFKLPTYKGLKIAPANVKVEDAEVAEEIERMRTGCATFADAKEDAVVATGDFAQFDYSGTIDGKSILEIAPEAKAVASGTGFWIQVEEGRFLKEILDALVGMKIGETKTGIKSKFDKTSAPEPLKGKKAEYTITVKAIRHRELPDDAKFLEMMKKESMDEFTAAIRAEMEKSAVDREANRRENDVVEMLLKKVDFDVPESLVRNAMNNYLNNFAERAKYMGIGEEYFKENSEKILKDAEATAVRQVRLWYIIKEIAKAEKIEGSNEEVGKKVIEFILANAK